MGNQLQISKVKQINNFNILTSEAITVNQQTINQLSIVNYNSAIDNSPIKQCKLQFRIQEICHLCI